MPAQVKYDSITDEVYGECACTQPQRCAMCTMGSHYRLSDECEKCPDNPWLTIIAIICLVIAALVGGYVLEQKRFNLAFISIGVDYFQVLAMFATSKIVWPEQLRAFFNLLTVFNLNIDIATPARLFRIFAPPHTPTITRIEVGIIALPVVFRPRFSFSWTIECEIG